MIRKIIIFLIIFFFVKFIIEKSLTKYLISKIENN